MRHRKSRLRLRQKPAHSRSLQRNLVTSVLLYETVRTTKKRAQVISPMIDRLITVAKTRPAHVAIRYINAVVTHKNASRKIMEVFKARYAKRSSGFTRMVPLGMRHGDGADLVNLMLVDAETAPVAAAVTDKPAKKAPKAKAAPKKKETSATAEKAESASSSAQ
jgi:large subunit ribosomal protein L17